MTKPEQPASSASAGSTTANAPPPLSIWQRLSNWWFGFEPSLPDKLRADARAASRSESAIDASSVDSVDNLFLSIADDPAVADFLDGFDVDVEEVAAEVRAAPIEAHVVEKDVVAGIRADAAAFAALSGAPLGVELFLLCVQHGPLTRVAVEEIAMVDAAWLVWVHCHGEPDPTDCIADTGPHELVLCNDPYTPVDFVGESLAGLGISAKRAADLIDEATRVGEVAVLRGDGAELLDRWRFADEFRQLARHPLRWRLRRA